MTVGFGGNRYDPAAIPIDTVFLDEQVSKLAGSQDHLRHYLACGLADGIDPTRFFSTDWYDWQNPDWCDGFAAPYLHYLAVGRAEGRDPSPKVDVVRYRECLGASISKPAIYGRILSGVRSVAAGVYEDLDQLTQLQRDFWGNIAVLAHRKSPPRRKRKSLVFCQAGQSACLDGWVHTEERDWDLLVNYYDAKGLRYGVGEYVFFQKGTKFTAMKLLSERFPEIFQAYDHVMFIDDDVEVEPGQIDQMFAACRAHGLDLAQMSLTDDSACNWAALYSRGQNPAPRSVSGVEIMMPVLSSRALGWIRPTLGQSISGFGLDLVWGKIVTDKGGRVAVLDHIAARHVRGADQAGGAYYQYLRRHHINAKAELWALINRYAAGRELIAV